VRSWRDRRVIVQLPLGYASGLPYLLVGTTLGTWLAKEHAPLATIGAFVLVGLPYDLKFVWAPLLDRFGRRRAWLLGLQIAVGVAIAALGMRGWRQPWLPVVVAFLAASQDTVVDAYRAEILPPELRAAGTAIFVFGYRLGMIAAGALALIAAKHTSWRMIYVALAATMAIGVVATLAAPEPPAARPPATLIDPIDDLFAGRKRIVLVLLFVLLFKLGYQVTSQLAQPFLVGIFPIDEVGKVMKGLGLACTILGGFVAAALLPRLGVRRSLIAFGGAMALSILPFALLARVGRSDALLVAAVAADSFAVGMALTALDTYLLGLCRQRYAATQLALFTSLAGLAPRLAGSGAGRFAAHAGWGTFFVAGALLGLPALVILAFLGEEDGRPRSE
jgi:PAT family beta-lactamase induction signal transducer AmpG